MPPPPPDDRRVRRGREQQYVTNEVDVVRRRVTGRVPVRIDDLVQIRLSQCGQILQQRIGGGSDVVHQGVCLVGADRPGLFGAGPSPTASPAEPSPVRSANPPVDQTSSAPARSAV